MGRQDAYACSAHMRVKSGEDFRHTVELLEMARVYGEQKQNFEEHFWAGYFASTVARNERAIRKYISNQE